MSLIIAMLNGDTFEHKSVTKWHFSQILKIHEYQKNSHFVTFEMKMSLCDTFISKVSPFEITIISDILTFGDKSDVCDAFFSPLVLYKKSHKVTFSNQILKIHNLSQKWHFYNIELLKLIIKKATRGLSFILLFWRKNIIDL